MRKSIFRNLVAGCLVVACCSAVQAQTTYSSVGPFVISQLKSDFIPSEGMVVVTPVGVTLPNPGGCPATEGAGIVATNASYKTLSAMILAAFLSGKQVKLWFASNAGCAVLRPALIGVEVMN